MRPSTPVDRVADFLHLAGFRRVATPVEIAGLKFEFPVAFIGSAPSPDLILIADTAFDTEQRILHKVQGVARALDVVRSKRPLTVVVAGPRPNSGTLDAMSKVSRVLPIGTVSDEDPDAVLKNWLAVLTPLQLPAPSHKIADPLGELATHIHDLDPAVQSLMGLASRGADAVEARLHEIIAEPLSDRDQQSTT